MAMPVPRVSMSLRVEDSGVVFTVKACASPMMQLRMSIEAPMCRADVMLAPTPPFDHSRAGRDAKLAIPNVGELSSEYGRIDKKRGSGAVDLRA